MAGKVKWSWTEDPNGCWIWDHAVDEETGYGKSQRGYAHRRPYERYVGPIPDGLELDHLCGVRSCINPEHLEPVTHVVNARRGKQTKLTADEVRQIRRLRSQGVSGNAIAELFSISPQNVCNIVKRRSWKDVA